MTKQEIFDTVVIALRAQGSRSWCSTRMVCMYRAPNGDKCAAGHLIPDDKYSEGLEESTFVGPHCEAVGIKPGSSEHQLIAGLQSIHDDYIVSEWEGLWEKLAGDFGLTYTPPEAV